MKNKYTLISENTLLNAVHLNAQILSISYILNKYIYCSVEAKSGEVPYIICLYVSHYHAMFVCLWLRARLLLASCSSAEQPVWAPGEVTLLSLHLLLPLTGYLLHWPAKRTLPLQWGMKPILWMMNCHKRGYLSGRQGERSSPGSWWNV